MKTQLIKGLAQLASKKYQHDFIVHGTKDEYVVPEEMVDTVRATIAAVLRHPTILTKTQSERLASLDRLAKRAYDATFEYDRNSLSTMIDSADWSAMRECARACLHEFGIEEPEMEAILIDA